MTTEDKILSILLKEPMDYWNLLAETNILIKNFIISLNKLKDLNYIDFNNELILLTDKGREYCIIKKIDPFRNFRCEKCRGRTVDFTQLPKEGIEKYLEIYKNHPTNISKYDQGCVTPEISLERVCYFLNRGDIQNSSIIFIGDDDLTSIALALFCKFDRIVVLDIDNRIVEYINEVAKVENIKNFEAFVYDVRDPLPKEFLRSFDMFFTDPVETITGFSVFINRGIFSLKGKNCTGYFGLTNLEASNEKWHLFEKNLINAGFIITDILEKFHYYNLPPLIGNKGYKVLDLAPFKVKSTDKLWYNSSLIRIYSVFELKSFDKDSKGDFNNIDFYLDDDGYVVSV